MKEKFKGYLEKPYEAYEILKKVKSELEKVFKTVDFGFLEYGYLQKATPDTVIITPTADMFSSRGIGLQNHLKTNSVSFSISLIFEEIFDEDSFDDFMMQRFAILDIVTNKEVIHKKISDVQVVTEFINDADVSAITQFYICTLNVTMQIL